MPTRSGASLATEGAPRPRREWSDLEDAAVAEAVARFGTRDWVSVAAALSEAAAGRYKTSKQCRARWTSCLDPRITSQPWTPAEEAIIHEAQAELGNRWATIVKRSAAAPGAAGRPGGPAPPASPVSRPEAGQ